jgi:outer membrane protein insertion porin family
MQDETSSSEGVQILFVTLNHGPHQYSLCSPQGHSPVKVRHTFIGRAARIFSRALVLVFLAVTAGAALAQAPQTIDEIRVIGNRRIPKETILARLFTHVGDAYDPISVERDFNSLWNTGYFEDLRIEREDTEKGVIVNIFVREKPYIREINYKGLNTITQSDILASTIPPGSRRLRR